MARKSGSSASFTELGEGILNDVERLLGQQIDLLRSELSQKLNRVEGAGLEMSAGGAALLSGCLLSSLATAQLLHRLTSLPLWACYGLTAGLLAVTGTQLVSTGA